MPYNVLIVDDDFNVRQIIGHICSKLGYKPIEAEDNQTALLLVEKEKPILLTTDYSRPNGCGVEFVFEMRRIETLAHIPIVMITGQVSKDVELAAWRAGINAFLAKLFGFDQLIDTILRLTQCVTDVESLLIHLGHEGRDLDYKEKIDFSSKIAKAELARDVIALANSGGGRLIIGVSEKNGRFSHVGLPENDLEKYETTRLNDSISRYVGSTAYAFTRVVCLNGLYFVIVKVPPIVDTIALALQSNQEAGLFTGRIYIRTQDGRTAELTDPLELQRLVNRLVDSRINKR